MMIGLVVVAHPRPHDRARDRAAFPGSRPESERDSGSGPDGLLFRLASGLVAGIGISRAWPTTLATAQLAIRWHTPLHLMKLLDDARERNLLRTVGPVYQFRHARLQDRLATTAVNGRNNRHTDQPLG